MRIISVLIIISFLLTIAGCSMPIVTAQKPLYSFTKEEKAVKGGFMGKKKSVTIKNFRESQAYEEEIDDLKIEVEKYISNHPDLSESAKSNLRKLMVTDGSTEEEVIFLLGKPDKIINATGAGHYGAQEIWMYRINKLRAVTFLIIPVFFVHESYQLYFKDGVLVEIEKHHLQQLITQSHGPGVPDSRK
ncbi:MAG: hypothetical protein PHW54_00720 [Candidatus Omnitrophica bacterium]|nr:hypothetical protein [Candidatus Omnitrophota bacterium]